MNKNFDSKQATGKVIPVKRAEKKKDPEVKEAPQKLRTPPRMYEDKRNYTPGKKTRFNLVLDEDLSDFMRGIVWERRLNMSAYVNGLIRADMEAYLKECEKKGVDPYDGWV